MRPDEIRRVCEVIDPYRGQTLLAEQLGVHLRTVRKWLEGETVMQPERVEKIRAVLEERRLQIGQQQREIDAVLAHLKKYRRA